MSPTKAVKGKERTILRDKEGTYRLTWNPAYRMVIWGEGQYNGNGGFFVAETERGARGPDSGDLILLEGQGKKKVSRARVPQKESIAQRERRRKKKKARIHRVRRRQSTLAGDDRHRGRRHAKGICLKSLGEEMLGLGGDDLSGRDHEIGGLRPRSAKKTSVISGTRSLGDRGIAGSVR